MAEPAADGIPEGGRVPPTAGILHIDQDHPPFDFENLAKTYRKTALTKAVRMHEPFVVVTSEGPLRCEDGYCAMDSRGYFYPIDANEFESIYEQVTE